MKHRVLFLVVSLIAFAGCANHAAYIETYAKGGVERWEDVSHVAYDYEGHWVQFRANDGRRVSVAGDFVIVWDE